MLIDTGKPVARLLLLVGDKYGGNCTMGGRKLSILDKFRSFGWGVTLAGVEKAVRPCQFAAERGAVPLDLDCTISEIQNVREFDVISVLPGPAFGGLIDSPQALAIIKTGFEQGLVISGWCRGVRVLAAADVVRGKEIVCHRDDRAFIEQAGGIFVGHDHLPVVDGTLVTCARSYHYRAKNAEAVRKAVMQRLLAQQAGTNTSG